MHDSLLKSALKLSKARRILLVEQIRDSLVDDGDAPHLTPEQDAELDRRMTLLGKQGSRGAPWESVKRRILQHARPTK